MRFEKEMQPAVERWLREREYGIAPGEVIFPAGYCDIVGYRFADKTGWRIPRLLKVVAVELKLDRVGEAIAQALGYQGVVTSAYVAMPEDRVGKMRPQTFGVFKRNGIGLLATDGRNVRVAVPATRNLDKDLDWLRKRAWKWQKREKKEGCPGAPG